MNRRDVGGQHGERRAVNLVLKLFAEAHDVDRSFSHGVFVMMATISLNTRPAWKRVQATA